MKRRDNKEKEDSPGALVPRTPGIVSMPCNQKIKKTVVKAEGEEEHKDKKHRCLYYGALKRGTSPNPIMPTPC